MMIFDWTITVGNLLTIVGFACSGIIFVALIRADVKILSVRISSLESVTKDMARVQVMMAEDRGRHAVQEDRLNIVSRRLDEHINETRAGFRNSKQ